MTFDISDSNPGPVSGTEAGAEPTAASFSGSLDGLGQLQRNIEEITSRMESHQNEMEQHQVQMSEEMDRMEQQQNLDLRICAVALQTAAHKKLAMAAGMLLYGRQSAPEEYERWSRHGYRWIAQVDDKSFMRLSGHILKESDKRALADGSYYHDIDIDYLSSPSWKFVARVLLQPRNVESKLALYRTFSFVTGETMESIAAKKT